MVRTLGGRRSCRRFYRLIAEAIPRTIEPVTALDLGCGTGLELREIFGASRMPP